MCPEYINVPSRSSKVGFRWYTLVMLVKKNPLTVREVRFLPLFVWISWCLKKSFAQSIVVLTDGKERRGRRGE